MVVVLAMLLLPRGEMRDAQWAMPGQPKPPLCSVPLAEVPPKMKGCSKVPWDSTNCYKIQVENRDRRYTRILSW